MNTIYVITGQTATGKTKYAIDLARKIDGEIVNADARQVYKNLDTVTGKDLHLTDRVFHLEATVGNFNIGYYGLDVSKPQAESTHSTVLKLWLYDIVNPSMNFSAHDYRICATNVIENIQKRGKTPIIVGGSYLYIKNLLYDTVNIRIPPDQKLRVKLSQLSVSDLQSKLSSLNPKILHQMNESDQQNPHRLIRKIEIEKGSDSHIKSQNHAPTFLQHNIQIAGFRYKKRDDLRVAVASRVYERIKNGAVGETKELLEKGYSINSPGINAIGYKQIILFFENKFTKEEMIEEWITKEVQYAKRQYTFMKKNGDILWTEL